MALPEGAAVRPVSRIDNLVGKGSSPLLTWLKATPAKTHHSAQGFNKIGANRQLVPWQNEGKPS